MAPSSKDFPDQSKEVLSFQPPPPPAGRQRTREAGLAQPLGLAKEDLMYFEGAQGPCLQWA